MKNAVQTLRKLNLRPTSQRIDIIKTLLSKGNIHITASKLKSLLSNKRISTATVYNNLNELSKKGFLKKVLVNNEKTWFDTNLEDHHHFYDQDSQELTDIKKDRIKFLRFPKMPKEKKLQSINIVINIKQKD